MAEVQSVASDQKVNSIVGATHRWIMKARRSTNIEEFVRKERRYGSQVPNIPLVFYVETDDGSMTTDTSS